MMRFRLSLTQFFVLLSVLSALFTAVPALAMTTGEIKGYLIDEEDGLPIPEVAVTITSENLIGGAQQRLTDEDGEFFFVGLPPGEYDVTAEKAGFERITYSGVVVLVGQTYRMDVTLPLEGTTDEIVVESKRKAVDVENTTRGEVLTKEFLQRIPAGRSYQSAIQMVAGVGPGNGGNPNMAGAAYNENTYMLDGATITDPVTGTFSLNFNYDAIQQIEVLLGGYMPEYGISLGGVVNLVTESGTNNLEFDSSVFYDNSNWRPRMDARYTADGFQLAPTGYDSSSTAVRISAKLSGPIIRDRAWFILSYQHTRTLNQSVGIDLPRDFDAHYVLGKLTVQPNAEHRITTFVQLDPTVIDNLSQGNPFIKTEAQDRQSQGGYVATGRWRWFLSPDANVDTQVVIQKSFIEAGGVPCTHSGSGYHPCEPGEAEGNEDWETPGRVGISGAYDSVNFGFFYFDDRFRYQANSKLSILSVEDPLGGTHDLKFGVEAVQNVWDQIQGYSGNTLYYDLNEVAFDPNTFQNYYWLEITGPIKFRTSMSQWNVFAQDEWKPSKNVTIKGGLRFDNAVVRNDLGDPVITGKLLGPRLYVAWDPFGKQKTKFSGGFGRFNDTGRLAVGSYVSAAGFGSKLFLGEFFQDGQGQGFNNTQDLMYDLGPSVNNNVSHDKIRMPRADEALFMFQQELVEDVALGVNLTGKFTRNMYEQEELNLIYDQDGSTIIGSRFGDQFYNIGRLRTPNLALRDYYQADVYVDKVMSKRWFARLTYSYTQSVGTSGSALSGSFLNDPQTQYNYGPMATDLRHVVKSYASWELPTDPWQQVIGASFTYWSGAPLERRYYNDYNQNYGSLRIRDRGIYHRFPDSWTLNVQIQQEFDVRKGKIIAQITAENITNNRAPEALSANFYRENRLFALSRQSPFGVTLGIRYIF